MAKLMNFRSKQNLPLFKMLDEVITSYGYEKGVIESSRICTATWTMPLSDTVNAKMIISLQPALPPDTWSIEPVIVIESVFARRLEVLLNMDDCGPKNPFIDYSKLLATAIMTLNPVNYYWQDRPEFVHGVLYASQETLSEIRQLFIEIYDEYAAPVLKICSTPSAFADFMLNSPRLYRKKRTTVDLPRYQLFHHPLTTSMLLIEADQAQQALSILEEWDKAEGSSPVFLSDLYGRMLSCKVKKLIQYLNSKHTSL
ncbi:hypothetical protein [Undibacterium squillarum]|uniref:hypothetical protein n=1 Tax=Undibacterium squillarum TaxID=1131567 RepID=UPI0035B09A54